MKKQFALLFGNQGRRKTRAKYDKEFDRNLDARAYKDLGFRVRKVNPPKNKPPTKVI